MVKVQLSNCQCMQPGGTCIWSMWQHTTFIFRHSLFSCCKNYITHLPSPSFPISILLFLQQCCEIVWLQLLRIIGEQLRSPEVFIASWKIDCIMETFELPNSVHIVVLMNMHSGMVVCQCVNSWHCKLCTLIPWETCIALLLQITFSLMCIIECGIQLMILHCGATFKKAVH